ncbi:hypothetical protein M513_03506 [Trichuris suis]|uniref:Uncharacterized protein n=1 Tax=Trichuris suis TaxID=68888 RepID=A0A085MEW2_9BILA|nr:hypothetical protein M513_03506 [Trichuris suis]
MYALRGSTIGLAKRYIERKRGLPILIHDDLFCKDSALVRQAVSKVDKIASVSGMPFDFFEALLLPNDSNSTNRKQQVTGAGLGHPYVIVAPPTANYYAFAFSESRFHDAIVA